MTPWIRHHAERIGNSAAGVFIRDRFAKCKSEVDIFRFQVVEADYLRIRHYHGNRIAILSRHAVHTTRQN